MPLQWRYLLRQTVRGEKVPESQPTSEDIKQRNSSISVQELRESRGGRAGLPVLNKPDGFCGRKARLK